MSQLALLSGNSGMWHHLVACSKNFKIQKTIFTSQKIHGQHELLIWLQDRNQNEVTINKNAGLSNAIKLLLIFEIIPNSLFTFQCSEVLTYFLFNQIQILFRGASMGRGRFPTNRKMFQKVALFPRAVKNDKCPGRSDRKCVKIKFSEQILECKF